MIPSSQILSKTFRGSLCRAFPRCVQLLLYTVLQAVSLPVVDAPTGQGEQAEALSDARTTIRKEYSCLVLRYTSIRVQSSLMQYLSKASRNTCNLSL